MIARFVLGKGERGFQGALACVRRDEATTPTVVWAARKGDATLQPIGAFAESVDDSAGTGRATILVDLLDVHVRTKRRRRSKL